MSFDVYVIVNGQNPQADTVLGLVNVKVSSIERYRDCGIDFEKKVIWVLARTGSTNAFHKKNKFDSNPAFIGQADDSYDTTYELLYFKIPPLANLKGIEHCPVPKMKEVVEKGVKELDTKQSNERAIKAMKELEKKINSSSSGFISLLDEN